MKRYSRHKCRKILKNGSFLYHKKGHKLTENERSALENDLEKLDTALLKKKGEETYFFAERVEAFIKTRFPKKLWDHFKELIYALLFAVVVAFFIRQFWFELYEVPTGSMRPTVKELDRLVVSKTTFGIHIPFCKKLLFYKPEYIKRAGTIIFTVAGMDVADSETIYFYLFPGKKRFVKRTVSKPGDILYFYGGRIYGVDKEGKPISELADESFLREAGIEKIGHIPYISMNGKNSVSSPLRRGYFEATQIHQMNQPVAKLSYEKNGDFKGLFFNGEDWLKDQPALLKKPHTAPVSYSDIWGIGNYAMARLLTRQELDKLYDIKSIEKGILYLELRHTPNLSYPLPEMRQDETGKIHPMITPYVAFIPLQELHLKRIQKSLTTSRFYVQNGRVSRYDGMSHNHHYSEFDPLFPGVPDGTYEFFNGKGYKVHFGGITSALPENHPLYNLSPENIQKLFNLGIGFYTLFSPIARNQPFEPQRFAYYREGDLYLMDAPILKSDDPTLSNFVNEELEKQDRSSEETPYIAFVDHGPPLKEDGSIDIDFIRAFGLKVPEDKVMALGDNYAMSADSRDFGFVPVHNLRGAASFTFWPPGSRMGPLAQPPYRWFTFPNLLIWSVVVIIAGSCLFYIYRRNQKPYFIKRDKK